MEMTAKMTMNHVTIYQTVKIRKFSNECVMVKNVDEIKSFKMYEYQIQNVYAAKSKSKCTNSNLKCNLRLAFILILYGTQK